MGIVENITDTSMEHQRKILSQTVAKFLFFALLALSLSFPQAPESGRAINSCVQPQTISFPFALQGGSGGVSLLANSVINGNVRSNANIQGELFAKINGNATAVGSINNVIVSGSKTQHATTTASLPALNLSDWKAAAAAGGTKNGDMIFETNSSGNVFGPKKINGNLVLMENSEVILKGTLYVTGSITIAKNARFVLSPAFGALGSVVVAEGQIDVDGNAHVEGNGGGSFLLMISSFSGSADAIIVNANFFSGSTVFYAINGGVLVDGNTNIIAAAGKRVEIGKNSQVNYSPGLAFASFICPPSPPSGASIITASKTPSKISLLPGEIYAYSLMVKNSGTATATNVSIVDVLSLSLDFASSTPVVSATSTLGSQLQLMWNLGDLGPGVQNDLTLQVKAKAGLFAGTVIDNSITVSGSNFNQFTASSSPVTVAQAPLVADLVASKIVNKSSAQEGEEVIYALSVKNFGPATSTQVTATDTLPTLLEFLSATSSAGTVYATSTGLWSIGTLASGTAASLEVRARVKSGAAGQTIVNTLIVSGQQADSDIVNNSAIASFSVPPAQGGGSNSTSTPPVLGGGSPSGGGGGGSIDSDLEITKTASPDRSVGASAVPVSAGQEFVYIIKIKNLSINKAEQVVATDLLPALVEFVSATTSQGSSYDVATGKWLVGELSQNQIATLQISVKLKPESLGQKIVNIATVSHFRHDPNAANNTASLSLDLGAGGGPQVGGAATTTFVGLKYEPPEGKVAGGVAAIKPKPALPKPATTTGEVLGEIIPAPTEQPAMPAACQPISWWMWGFIVYALLMFIAFALQQQYPNRYWMVFPIVLLICALLWWGLEPCVSARAWYWPVLIGLMFLVVMIGEWQKYLPEKFRQQKLFM